MRRKTNVSFGPGAASLILIVVILVFNGVVNKLTGASIDSGIGGGK